MPLIPSYSVRGRRNNASGNSANFEPSATTFGIAIAAVEQHNCVTAVGIIFLFTTGVEMAKRLTLFAFLFCCIQLIWSQTSAIDKARSKVTVRVYKSGLFSAFAHDHTISAPISSGELDPTARRVQVSFHAADMK